MSIDAILACSFVAFASILVGIFVVSVLARRYAAAGAPVTTPPEVSPEDPTAPHSAPTGGGLFSMVGAPWSNTPAQASKELQDKGQIQGFHQDKAEMRKDARSRGAPEMRVETMGVNEHQGCWSCGC